MKVQCRTCLAILVIEGNTRDLRFDPVKTPYGGPYPHKMIADCPLLKGLSIDELKSHPEVAMVEG